ncbi:MAG: acyl-CoA/acyl-ACP dehydrogenase [Pseudomonadales bacterium]|nr:acyl-CoA/acyl-ACP dehydrogenase [Pseudomonadales bacterium]MCP5188668.1 acyl-CoA/acyl-ACP dehydrogenase [Pseudomonadales bacterium]
MSVIGNNALSFSEEQAMLLDVAREFCRDKSPMAAVRAQLETERGFDPAIWDEMVALGWAGIALPEACGGSGMGVASVVPVVEAMGRAMLGTPLISTTLAAQLLLRAGGAGSMEATLASIAGGSIATVALLENADWGDTRIGCQLDGSGVLQGNKKYVTDAEAADLFVVPVEHAGAPALAVVKAEQLAAGAIAPNTLIDQTKRSASVDFSGVQVAQEGLLTGAAVSSALRDLYLLGALLTAAEATGSAASCLATIVEYLKTRKQFGKLIGSYQALKHPAVDILCAVDSGRSFIYHAATLVGDEALDRDAEIACRMAKAHATETLLYAGDRAVQFHGGMGFTYECDAQLYIRRAQWSQQQYGDAQHHRKRLADLLL